MADLRGLRRSADLEGKKGTSPDHYWSGDFFISGCWYAGCWLLVAGYRMPDAGYWMLVIGILTSNT
jgi:hypothetical protein